MKYRGDRNPGWIGRLVQALGPKALIMWGLLLLVTFTMASGLTEAVVNLDTIFVFSVAALAMTLGWLLALLPIQGWMVAALGVLLGTEFLLIRVGRLGDSLLLIVNAIGTALRETAVWYWTEVPPNWEAVGRLYLDLWRDMGTLLQRTFIWLSSLAVGGGAIDLVGTAIVWGLGVWLYSLWSGYITRRHFRPLLGLLPGGIVVGFVLSWTNSNPYVFLPIMGAGLVLLALMRQWEREDRWTLLNVDFSQGLWSDVALVATGLSIALVIAGAIAPSVSAQRVADWVREMTERGEETRTEVAENLGLEQKPEPRAPRPLAAMRSTGLPRRHLIGSTPELNRVVVMLVETGEIPPIPEAMTEMEAPRHYWRSITYDRYFGSGWATSATEDAEYEAGEPAIDAEVANTRVLRQSVRFVGDGAGGMIHVDGTLVSVDEPYEVSWRPPGEMFAAITTAREYRADSLIVQVTEEGLRETSTEYPDWIASRYLQLPESVPDRVLALARDLTATEPTAYDRAVAIEQYLRQFPYNLDVPTPGRQNDIADYFLFELQEGYCDYYATSMVVLARAAGLPTRMVIGYINGSYDPMNARYVVTEADAHAWPEIYFPGYGWVEFEPTGGRPPIVRSPEDREPIIWPEGEGPGPLVPTAEPFWRPRLVFGAWVLGLVGGVALFFALVTGIDSLFLLTRSPEEMMRRLFGRLRVHARRLQTPIQEGDTPYEMSEAFADRFARMSKGRGEFATDTLDLATYEVRDLADAYVRIWYSADGRPSVEERRGLVWTWWMLRWRLWAALLWRGRSVPAGDETTPQRRAMVTTSRRTAT